jgi:hypothetical protein
LTLSNLELQKRKNSVHKCSLQSPSADVLDHGYTTSKLKELQDAGKELKLDSSEKCVPKNECVSLPQHFGSQHPKCTQEIVGFAPGSTELSPTSNTKNCKSKQTMDFLSKFGISHPQDPLSIHSSWMNKENPFHEGQDELKKTWQENYKNENSIPRHIQNMDWEPSNYHSIRMVDESLFKKARLNENLSRSHWRTQNLNHQELMYLMDPGSQGKSVQQSADSEKLEKKQKDPLEKQKFLNNGIDEDLVYGRGGYSCAAPLNIVPDEQTRNSILGIQRQGKMKKSDDQNDLVEYPSPEVEPEVKAVLEKIRTGSKFHTLLDDGNGSELYYQKNFFYSVLNQSIPEFDKINSGNSSRKEIYERYRSLWHHKDQWFNFWERTTGINILIEIKRKVYVSKNVEKLLHICLFYIEMIEMIIKQDEGIQPVIEKRKEIFSNALKVFEKFTTSSRYEKFKIEDPHSSYSLIHTLVWPFLNTWIKDLGNKDLEILAFRGKDYIYDGFKRFFNNMLKFSCEKIRL